MRICLVGPVVPYRGGIAQHTTMLHRTLRSRCELLTVSYRRQYPRWLFPGRSCLEPEAANGREPGVHYLIDSLNPITWLQAVERIAAHAPQLVVIPWWTVFWAPWCLWTLAQLKRREIPCAFLCHNVQQHEAGVWHKAITRMVFRRGHRFLVPSWSEARRLRGIVPKAIISVSPLPVFEQFPLPRRQLPRRAGLELLFFGLVRPYKGLDTLLEASRLLRDEDVHLSVVGEWWRRDRSLLQLAKARILSGRLEIVDRYVSLAEAADYFARADVVVLPYRNASCSGVIPLAYHYGKPVIVTRVGGLPEMVREGWTGSIVPPDDPASLADAIRRYLDQSTLQQTSAGARHAASWLSWDGLADTLLGMTDTDAAVRATVGLPCTGVCP